ncbi:MAG TPA: hypothetical protein DCM86_10840 [Verrucomicrobiales bacterium]|nr:hypothetical protein [Verrucomicrobiales bacterium]
MRRPGILLAASLAVALAVFGLCYTAAFRMQASRLASSTDDLEWLRQAFRMGDAEFTQVRRLHEGYRARCGEVCRKIAERNRELQQLLASPANETAAGAQAVEAKLKEIAALRAECQAGMLRHFQEVAASMPSEEGRRYLSEMRRLTLENHSGIEAGMSHHHESAPPP